MMRRVQTILHGTAAPRRRCPKPRSAKQRLQRVQRATPRPRAALEGHAMANGAPFESPRAFYSRARDLMVNGFDLIEELSEVTLEPAEKRETEADPTTVNTVSYFGSRGAFCEEAAKGLYSDAEMRPVASWGGTIDELLRGNVDRAVVPIENYITKRTRILYDLICKYDLHIVDEAFLNVHHALLVKPNAQKGDIKIIGSHIQGLFQCEQYVIQNFPTARLERINDTAVAARMVADYPTNEMAAIASRACGDQYGLKILEDNIQDRPDNVTRFASLGRHPLPPEPSERSKTSILFALPEDTASGTLGRALEIFATHGINLLWLDSRELHSTVLEGNVQPWNYLFYVNLEGSSKDGRIQEALDELESICLFFRVIGSYRMQARYLEDYVTP